jgi:DNA-binding transcriptional LysR family regulator
MDRIECLRSFVEAVRVNSFAAAARTLDVPRSRISKQIQALEGMLGVQLIMRTTRSLHLTAAGTEYFDAVQPLIAAFDDADERVRASVGRLGGTLRVNAPLSYGTRVLGPLIPAFHAENPLIELHIALTDQFVDPIRGGFDVTIRIADLVDSSLVAKRLMPAERVLVASPGYLQSTSTPNSPAELSRHSFLNYGCIQGGAALPLTNGTETVRVQPIGPAVSDNGDLLAILAEAGMGITLLPRFIVQSGLDSRRLVQVLPDWKAPPISVNALFPAGPQVPQKTRRFVDFLSKRLANGKIPHRSDGDGTLRLSPIPE